MTITLRPYQNEAIAAIKRDWHAGINDVLLTMATGGGKTAVFLALLNNVLVSDKRGLVIAHLKEVIDQPLARLHCYFPNWEGRAGIVMAATNQPDKQLIVATVQTLAIPGRVDAILAHGKIDYLVVDECFPEGTLVDGRPIETIQVGDTVTAYDFQMDSLLPGTVTYVFKRPAPSKLIRITAGQYQVVCTPNHPILTSTGFVDAGEITTEDKVYVDLLSMQQGIRADKESNNQPETLRESMLLGGMPAKEILRNNGGNQSEVRQCQDEGEQSNAQSFQP